VCIFRNGYSGDKQLRDQGCVQFYETADPVHFSVERAQLYFSPPPFVVRPFRVGANEAQGSHYTLSPFPPEGEAEERGKVELTRFTDAETTAICIARLPVAIGAMHGYGGLTA